MLNIVYVMFFYLEYILYLIAFKNLLSTQGGSRRGTLSCAASGARRAVGPGGFREVSNWPA